MADFKIPWCGAVENFMKDITFTTSGRLDKFAMKKSKITKIPFNVPGISEKELLTQLNSEDNYNELTRYLDKSSAVYGEAVRIAFSHCNKGKAVSKTQYRKVLADRLGIKVSVAYDAISEAEKYRDAHFESTKKRIVDLKARLEVLKKEYAELENKRIEYNLSVRNWLYPPKDACIQNAHLKKALYWKKQAIIKKQYELQALEKEVNTKIIKHYCFGGWYFFKKQNSNYKYNHAKWLEKWRLRRDRCIVFGGSQDEAQGNRLIKLYSVKEGSFDNQYFIMRCLSIFRDDMKKARYFIIRIPYNRAFLNEVLMLNNQAVQYRFKRAKDGYSWYLDVILQRNRTIKANSREFQSLDKEEAFLKNRKYAYIDDTYFENTKLSGMIGVDMNDGFLSATYLSKKEEYERSKDLFFTTEDSSTKNKERLLTHISELVKEAKELNYGIAIEDLDFTKKKRAKNGKARNRMLHNFATRRCREAFESACSKNNVRFFIVSPAYTTRIGRKLYAPKYEISVHQAAALTIALRAMGKQFDVEEYK